MGERWLAKLISRCAGETASSEPFKVVRVQMRPCWRGYEALSKPKHAVLRRGTNEADNDGRQ
jgi:hypothetical protein